MANDAQLKIDTLNGTGPGGRIRRDDVNAAIAARETVVQPTPAPTEPVTTIAATKVQKIATATPTAADWVDEPHSRMRALIATRLTASKSTVPHFYLRASVRVDPLLALRAELNAGGSGKISVNDLILKAAAHAYTVVPEMNVVWTDSALRRYSRVDISVAVASERGLVNPPFARSNHLHWNAFRTGQGICAASPTPGG